MTNTELRPYKRSRFNRSLNMLALCIGFGSVLLEIILGRTGVVPLGGQSSWELTVRLGLLFALFIGSFAEWGYILEAANHDDVKQPSRAKAWLFSVMTLIYLFWVATGY